MVLLKETFHNTNTKSEVNDIQKFVKNLMIKVLDLRNSNRNNNNSKQINELEDCCNEAFSVFIPKLNEITFRPLFYKVCHQFYDNLHEIIHYFINMISYTTVP